MSKESAAKWRRENAERKKEYQDAYRPKWNAENKDKVAAHQKTAQRKRQEFGYFMQRRYGVTIEDFNAKMKEQEGKCAICSDMLKTPQVDHCHTTGKFRGLLCMKCNTSIGKFRDDPEIIKSALDYVLKHQ